MAESKTWIGLDWFPLNSIRGTRESLYTWSNQPNRRLVARNTLSIPGATSWSTSSWMPTEQPQMDHINNTTKAAEMLLRHTLSLYIILHCYTLILSWFLEDSSVIFCSLMSVPPFHLIFARSSFFAQWKRDGALNIEHAFSFFTWCQAVFKVGSW